MRGRQLRCRPFLLGRLPIGHDAMQRLR